MITENQNWVPFEALNDHISLTIATKDSGLTRLTRLPMGLT